jgi:ABC-type Na+ efflux pump permease subunit
MILGLSIPKFLGAILVGLILSGVLITLLVPHDEIPKPIVSPINQVSLESDMVSLITRMVYLSGVLVIIGVLLSIIASSVCVDRGRY